LKQVYSTMHGQKNVRLFNINVKVFFKLTGSPEVDKISWKLILGRIRLDTIRRI